MARIQMVKKSTRPLISVTGDDPVKQFKKTLQELRKFKGFLGWSESNAFSRQLGSFIANLGEASIDPKTGIELVLEFYRTDQYVLNACDDSDGTVGEVYTLIADDLFVQYGQACEKKEWIAGKVLDLNREDPFGVRSKLIDRAAEYLPPDILRTMAEKLWAEAQTESNEYEQRGILFRVESLARQLKDPQLFVKACLLSWGGKVHVAGCIDIAKVYLEANDAATALSWIQKIPSGNEYMADQCDDLLFSIYRELGKKDGQVEVAWRIFRRTRSPRTLDLFLSVIGEHERDRVVKDEINLLSDEKELHLEHVHFMVQMGDIENAEKLVLIRSEQLNGDWYYSILPLVEIFEQHNRFLASSLMHRALVNSILARAISKNYHHAVRYMRHLRTIAKLVENWQGFETHKDYVARIEKLHGRKTAFWEKMGRIK